MPEMPTLSRLWNVVPTVSVGVLAADLSSVASEVKRLETAGAELLHVDVMDGCFVPKMTMGPPFINAIRTRLLKDVHLMIENPVGKVIDYVRAGADMITLHIESGRHLHRALQAIAEVSQEDDREGAVARGVALNPSTPVDVVEPFLDEVDLITLVAVNPGWNGQKFIPSTRRRFARLKRMIHDSGREILTVLDGGINRENIADVSELGADIIVSGSAVFDGKVPDENLKFMMDAIRRGRTSRGRQYHA